MSGTEAIFDLFLIPFDVIATKGTEVRFDSQTACAPLYTANVFEKRIASTENQHDLRSTKLALWDHFFELPHKHLETEKQIRDRAQVGTVTRKLKVGDAERLALRVGR